MIASNEDSRILLVSAYAVVSEYVALLHEKLTRSGRIDEIGKHATL